MVPKSRNVYQNVVLTVITVFLGVLAFKPAVHAPPVFAQTDPRYLYVEPGTTAVRAPDGSSQQTGQGIHRPEDRRHLGIPYVVWSALPGGSDQADAAGLEAGIPGPIRSFSHQNALRGGLHERKESAHGRAMRHSQCKSTPYLLDDVDVLLRAHLFEDLRPYRGAYFPEMRLP